MVLLNCYKIVCLSRELRRVHITVTQSRSQCMTMRAKHNNRQSALIYPSQKGHATNLLQKSLLQIAHITQSHFKTNNAQICPRTVAMTVSTNQKKKPGTHTKKSQRKVITQNQKIRTTDYKMAEIKWIHQDVSTIRSLSSRCSASQFYYTQRTYMADGLFCKNRSMVSESIYYICSIFTVANRGNSYVAILLRLSTLQHTSDSSELEIICNN